MAPNSTSQSTCTIQFWKRLKSLHRLAPLCYDKGILVAATRDVNEADRVRVVAPPYFIRWINIRLIPVPISVRVSIMRVPAYFF